MGDTDYVIEPVTHPETKRKKRSLTFSLGDLTSLDHMIYEPDTDHMAFESDTRMYQNTRFASTLSDFSRMSCSEIDINALPVKLFLTPTVLENLKSFFVFWMIMWSHSIIFLYLTILATICSDDGLMCKANSAMSLVSNDISISMTTYIKDFGPQTRLFYFRYHPTNYIMGSNTCSWCVMKVTY